MAFIEPADPRSKPAARSGLVAGHESLSVKISSILIPNSRVRLNASGKLGSNFPGSMALTDCRDTSSRWARSPG